MSLLSKEDLLEIKEQFKSVHNVMPHRFAVSRTLNEGFQIEKGGTVPSQFEDGSPIKDRRSFMAKHPVDLSYVINNKKQNSKTEREEYSSRSQEFYEIKKYNYTKNSLNCIPLSNKFRQMFIRFVEWKH